MIIFKKQSGFALPIAILIVVVLVVAGGAGYYFYKTSQELEEIGEEVVDETADWKIYQNEEYGFEIKYPEDWKIEEATIADSEVPKPISVFGFCPKDKVYYHTVGGYTRGTMNPISIEIWKSMEDYQKIWGGVSGAKEVLISDNISALYWGNELGEIFYIIQHPNKNIVVIFRSEIGMILHQLDSSEIEELKEVFSQILSTFKFIESEEVGEEEKAEPLIEKYSNPEKTLSLFIKVAEEGDIDAYLECFTEESQKTLKTTAKLTLEELKAVVGFYGEAEYEVIEKTDDRAVMTSLRSMPGTIKIFVFRKEREGWKIDFEETFIQPQRDTKRVTDLMGGLRRGALEFYYDQHGGYPVLTDTSEDGEFLKVLIDEGYLAEMFLDPLHPKYFYEYEGSKNSYTLKCYCEVEGGNCDMADGVKDHVFILIFPKE